jgi:outer membrane protein assembly factor BamB
MNNTPTRDSRPLRLWPGLAAAVLLAISWYIAPMVFPDLALGAMTVGLAAIAIVVLWWVFFSRAPWADRVGFILLAIVALIASSQVIHESIAGGMMGFMLYIYAVPVVCLAFVAAAAIGSRFTASLRRLTMAAAILIACGTFAALRTDGMLGFAAEFQLRWTPTAEERLLAQAAERQDPVPPAIPPSATAPATAQTDPLGRLAKPVDTRSAKASDVARTTLALPVPPAPAPDTPERNAWPGFRGPKRDGIVPGVRIETDWAKSAPVQMWRKPIGPAWSSFAVHGSYIYTQEQRGEDEIVSCYDLSTGTPVWRHRDKARFWESNAGAGPRATPTLSNGRVYTLGATGIVNALDARNGSVVWSRNAQSDTGATLPIWAFAGSPLVVGDMVIVATGGRLAAYDIADGKLQWTAKSGGGGYSSPQLEIIDGTPQILLLNTNGAVSVSPQDGKELWKHEWNSDGVVQPAVIDGRDVLIGSGSGGAEVGMRRISVAPGSAGWSVQERWTSTGLKPYFNDFVVHKGHAYGFDGSILSCIDLADGKRKWKGGRYGQGQMVLLPDQDLLLLVGEEGELALVRAAPDRFTELARGPGIEGKTWNHPVLIGDILLVRNSEEMVAFRLTRRD